MGLFGFFRDRRARESAIPGTEGDLSSQPAGAQPSSVNEINGLGDLGTMLSQLHQMREAGAEIQASKQVFDLRGGDARSEILEVLRQRGVDPGSGGAAPDDPAAMQQDIFAALERAGLDLSAMGIPIPGADQAASPAEELDLEALRRDPDSGIRNPLDR